MYAIRSYYETVGAARHHRPRRTAADHRRLVGRSGTATRGTAGTARAAGTARGAAGTARAAGT